MHNIEIHLIMRKRDRELREIRLGGNETFEEYVKKREKDEKYRTNIKKTTRLIHKKNFIMLGGLIQFHVKIGLLLEKQELV